MDCVSPRMLGGTRQARGNRGFRGDACCRVPMVVHVVHVSPVWVLWWLPYWLYNELDEERKAVSSLYGCVARMQKFLSANMHP